MKAYDWAQIRMEKKYRFDSMKWEISPRCWNNPDNTVIVNIHNVLEARLVSIIRALAETQGVNQVHPRLVSETVTMEHLDIAWDKL